jgi:multidrug efflux pump subunit AcrB
MGLIGVAMNDAIVVLAAIQEDERARMGASEAVRDVVLRSSRHVFATTFTTIAGFIPLIIEAGGFWPPLAVTIAGGVGGATLLALVFVPSSYLLVNRVRQGANERELKAADQLPIAVDGVASEFAVV